MAIVSVGQGIVNDIIDGVTMGPSGLAIRETANAIGSLANRESYYGDSAFDSIDVQSGMGKIFVEYGGKRIPYAHAKDINAVSKKRKIDIQTCDSMVNYKKTVGIEYSGSLTIYDIDSEGRLMMEKLRDTGVDVYMTIVVNNYDSMSQAQEQSVKLLGVNFDEEIIAQVSSDKKGLERKIPFTFHGSKLIKKYNDVRIGRY